MPTMETGKGLAPVPVRPSNQAANCGVPCLSRAPAPNSRATGSPERRTGQEEARPLILCVEPYCIRRGGLRAMVDEDGERGAGGTKKCLTPSAPSPWGYGEFNCFQLSAREVWRNRWWFEEILNKDPENAELAIRYAADAGCARGANCVDRNAPMNTVATWGK